MTHEQYNVLLDAWLEGTLSKEEETELLIYESEHPECTKQREALSDLQQELSQLGGEIPPVPADFRGFQGAHAAVHFLYPLLRCPHA